MVGRAIINDPYQWRTVDSRIFHTLDPGVVSLPIYYLITHSLLIDIRIHEEGNRHQICTIRRFTGDIAWQESP